MCYFDVILLSDVISSIGPKLSDADTYVSIWLYLLSDTFFGGILFSWIFVGTTSVCHSHLHIWPTNRNVCMECVKLSTNMLTPIHLTLKGQCPVKKEWPCSQTNTNKSVKTPKRLSDLNVWTINCLQVVIVYFWIL